MSGDLEQVGWLWSGVYVICPECRKTKLDLTKDVTPIYRVNLVPYRQPCALCNKELIEPNCGTILYDGRILNGNIS